MLALVLTSLTGLLLFAATSAFAATSNPTAFTITSSNTDGTPQAATLYPSDINASDVTGTISKVTATVTGFKHVCSTDVDMLLVGPGGQRSILMSDAGDCADTAATTHPAVNLTFDQDATASVPCDINAQGQPIDTTTVLATGTYKPTDFLKGATPGPTGACSSNNTFEDSFPTVGVGPFPASLAAFNGTSATGVWHLYVVDQYKNDAGSIAGGWSLKFTITPPTVTAPAVLGTTQVGQTLTAASGTITSGGAASWQWQRCDGSGTICAPISGATAATYAPQLADVGSTLKVTETATNTGGGASATSGPTAAVAPAPTIGPQQPNLAAVVSSRKTKTVQKVLSQGGVLAAFTSSASGALVASGTVSVPNLAKTYRFTVLRSKVVAGNPTQIKLKLSRKALKAIKKALAKHKKLSAKITLVVTTSSGAKTTVHKTIRFKR